MNSRDPHGVLAMTVPGNGLPLSWASLHLSDAPGCRDKRTAALVYAKLGLVAIALHGVLDDGVCTCGADPCGDDNRNAGKHPVAKNWQLGDVDPLALDEMLMRNWRFNIGIRTGYQRNGRFLVVIDLDGPRSLLEPLEKEHGPLPPTLVARTGRGGLHFYYWLRSGVEMGNRAGIVPKVDVRGEGGQVVASPSRHASGNYYTWLDVREPEVLP